MTFAAPVDPATVTTAIRLDPATAGVVVPSLVDGGSTRYTFVPPTPLRPDTAYELSVSGVRDLDGVPLETVALAVRTRRQVAPASSASGPRADTKDVARDAAISVRFTASMDRAHDRPAFKVSVGGKPIAGKVRWAEGDTVIVFTPSAPLPYGTTVSMDVAATAPGARPACALAAPGPRGLPDGEEAGRGHDRQHRRADRVAAAAEAARSAAAAGPPSRRTTSA